MAEITVKGQTFTAPEFVAPLAFMRYSEAAVRGVDSDSPEGMAAMYVLLKACFAAEDWDRFERLALAERLTHAELLAVVTQMFEAVTERPTERPSESSDGPEVTSQSSEVDSSSPASPVVDRLEGKGRPDLALQVVRTQEFLTEQGSLTA